MKKFTLVFAHESDPLNNEPHTVVVKGKSAWDAWDLSTSPKDYCVVAIFEGELENLVYEID